MTLELRDWKRTGDAAGEAVLEAAFHRPERESRLARELARAHPSFDPALAPVAELDGKPVGCAVLLPRTLLLRGVPVAAVVVGPMGVDPTARGRGVGGALVDAALERAAGRGALFAVALGAREFFASRGFAPAFDLWGLHVPGEVLPEGGDTSAWRGLAGEDLPGLMRLHAHAYREISLAERRTGDALDWESLAERAHTLVHPGDDGPLAYLRFRVREAFELLECGASSAAGVDAVLAMARRLIREHTRLDLFARLPEPHPVARALFHRGAIVERSNLGGAGMLRVLDWPALLSVLAPVWSPALEGLERPAFSIGVGENAWRLELLPAGPRVTEGRAPGAHLALPAERTPALLTGQRGFDEVFAETRVRRTSDLAPHLQQRLAAYLGPRAATWGYAPPFELADD